MNNVDNEIFGFGNDYNYDTISGLGESDYENEDLFGIETKEEENNTSNETIDNTLYETVESLETPIENLESYSNELKESNDEEVNTDVDYVNPFDFNLGEENENIEQIVRASSSLNQEEVDTIDSVELQPEEEIIMPLNENNGGNENEVQQEVEESPIEENNSNIAISDTPIEEINKLTEYEEEKVETIDINTLFDRVGVNVKEASDIFKKNSEMKEKIDSRFEELKKLQLEVEKSKQSQYDEINSYKAEVLEKLNEKKEEIEKRLNKLKEFQASLEKEKEEFETYKRTEKAEIEKVQKEVQDAYDSRREELNHVEDILRKQKDALDEERSQLSLDRIKYEADKNELANNLLKFNEIVDSFTSGMDKINKE